MTLDLDSLLRSAKREAHLAKVEKRAERTAREATLAKPSWTAGRVIALFDPTGNPLGHFREYTDGKGGRKLERCLDALSPDAHETLDILRGSERASARNVPTVEGGDEDVRRYLSRRTAEEIKSALASINTEDLFRELDQDF